MRKPITDLCSVSGCVKARRSRRCSMCDRHRYLMERYGSTDDPSFSRECEWCGSVFRTTRSRARFCREECRRLREGADRRARNATRCRVWVGDCAVCGRLFVSPGVGGVQKNRTCSDECFEIRHREQARLISERQCEEMPKRKRHPESYHLNDVRRQGAEVSGEVFAREDVYERDGWVCQLCGKPVDRGLEWPDPFSASLDHVVPVSAGGEHSLLNCQLAHLRCNQAKGARVA